MARILIVYGTTEGHTRTITQRIAERIRSKGHDVETANVATSPPLMRPGMFDAYIIGGSIHLGKHLPALVEFTRKHVDILHDAPNGYFMVCLTAAVHDEHHDAEVRRMIDEFVEETNWRPQLQHAFAGALMYSKYGFIKRMLMKSIAKRQGGDVDTSRDYIYTDWNDVDRFVDEFLRSVEMHVDQEAELTEHA